MKKYIEPPFDFGNKEREIATDKKTHFISEVVITAIFNFLSLIAIIYFNVMAKFWVWIVLGVILFGLIVYFSVKKLRHSQNCHCYEIFENGLKIESDWYDVDIKFKDIVIVEAKTTLFDRIFGNKTRSIQIYAKQKRETRFTLPFICENVEELKSYLMEKVLNARAKEKSDQQ